MLFEGAATNGSAAVPSVAFMLDGALVKSSR